MSKQQKKKIGIAETIKKTSFIVYLFSVVLSVILLMQAVPEIFASLNRNLGMGLPALNLEAQMPLELAAWFFMSLCAIYTGADRAAYFKHSSQLSYGKAALGNPGKLRKLILLTFLIFVEGAILEVLFKVHMPLEALMSAFGATCLLYVGGQKSIRFASAVDGDKATSRGQSAMETYSEEPALNDSLEDSRLEDIADPATIGKPSMASKDQIQAIGEVAAGVFTAAKKTITGK